MQSLSLLSDNHCSTQIPTPTNNEISYIAVRASVPSPTIIMVLRTSKKKVGTFHHGFMQFFNASQKNLN